MGHSTTPDISSDGRYVAFASTAALVPEDANGCSSVSSPTCTDIYVHDRTTATTTRSASRVAAVKPAPSAGSRASLATAATSSSSHSRPTSSPPTRTAPSTSSSTTARQGPRLASAWPATRPVLQPPHVTRRTVLDHRRIRPVAGGRADSHVGRRDGHRLWEPHRDGVARTFDDCLLRRRRDARPVRSVLSAAEPGERAGHGDDHLLPAGAAGADRPRLRAAAEQR